MCTGAPGASGQAEHKGEAASGHGRASCCRRHAACFKVLGALVSVGLVCVLVRRPVLTACVAAGGCPASAASAPPVRYRSHHSQLTVMDTGLQVSVVLTSVELVTETNERQKYSDFMLRIKAQYNVTEQDWETLTDYTVSDTVGLLE